MAGSRHTSQVTRNWCQLLSLLSFPLDLLRPRDGLTQSPRNQRQGSNMASNSSVLTSSALLGRAYLPRSSGERSRTKSHGTDWLFVQPWSWEGGSATQKLPERRARAGQAPKGNQGADARNGNGRHGDTHPVKSAQETDVKKTHSIPRLPYVTPGWELMLNSALKGHMIY